MGRLKERDKPENLPLRYKLREQSMKKKILVFAMALLIGLHLFGKQPVKIVSLAQSISTMLVELGVEDQIVGCTNYCPVKDAASTTVVSSAIDANIELIAALHPDIVFTTSLTKPQTIETISKLGIKVVNLAYPKSFNEICEQFLQLSEYVNKKTYAIKIIDETKQKLAQLSKSEKKPKLFLQIGANPLFTVVPNTFMNDMISKAGGVNIAQELKLGSITREKVLLENPDYIFIVSMGILSTTEKENWQQFTNLSAVKNNHIYQIDSNIACTPTPENFLKSVEILLNYLTE